MKTRAAFRAVLSRLDFGDRAAIAALTIVLGTTAFVGCLERPSQKLGTVTQPVSGSLIEEALPGVELKDAPSVTLDAGSATALASAPDATDLAHHAVTVQADKDNTETIRVGTSSVSATRGFQLQAGQSISIEVKDPSHLYGYAGDAGQKVNAGWL